MKKPWNKGTGASVSEIFFRHVIHKEGTTCWGWAGFRDKDGYGILTVPMPNRKRGWGACGAHRVSWAIHNGEIPVGLWVLHKCDNPECTNPEHLFLGDAQDNSDDMFAKGRQRFARGTHHYKAKLTPEFVESVRAEYESSSKPRGIQRRLAEKYGVDYRHLHKILNGELWVRK